MANYLQITPNVYQVGGSGYSGGNDCCVYLLDGVGSWALIDTGVGDSARIIGQNIMALMPDKNQLQYIIATHGHIDHIGGLAYLLKMFPQAKLVAHRLELPAIEEGLPNLTAADWYGVKYDGVKVDTILDGKNTSINVGETHLNCLYTPGHTPGGISPYLDQAEERILFGQDIHGPFNKSWGSNMDQWQNSMQKLLDLKADILCEGHFGTIRSNPEITEFIQGFLHQYNRKSAKR